MSIRQWATSLGPLGSMQNADSWRFRPGWRFCDKSEVKLRILKFPGDSEQPSVETPGWGNFISFEGLGWGVGCHLGPARQVTHLDFLNKKEFDKDRLCQKFLYSVPGPPGDTAQTVDCWHSEEGVGAGGGCLLLNKCCEEPGTG